MKNQVELEDFIFIQALENAFSFKGKANPKAIIGKCMSKYPEVKKEMSELMPILNSIVGQVNNLNLENQTLKLKELNPSFFEKKEKIVVKRDGLPELDNAEPGKVVLRFEPAPSGYLHLGHIFPIVANYELKKKYDGKFILRIADTNPDNIDIENYDRVIEDVKWICNNEVDEIVYQSDRLSIYYKYLRTLIELGGAYVCSCDSETFKAYTDSSEACPHRNFTYEKNLDLYEDMFNGKLKSGEAVVRAKADLENKNPALRSFALARINENKHARLGNKYRVWPNMNLSVAIDDVLMGLTHVIRGKDLEIGMHRQGMLHKILGMKSPYYFHTGKMKFLDMNLSKSDLSEKIKNKEFDSWDDPRVPSIIAYRKRGYKAEAFRKFILSLGISKRDSKISSQDYHKGLDYYNKQILEKECDRFFFVHNSKKVHIINLDDFDISFNEISLPKHPEDKSRGERKFKFENEYLIDSIDFDNLNVGDKIRLMHFANFKIVEKDSSELKLKYISIPYEKELKVKRNIHFLPMKSEKCSIILSDNSKLKGNCEYLDNIKENTSLQFERFGFVKYDSKDDRGLRKFYFTHR